MATALTGKTVQPEDFIGNGSPDENATQPGSHEETMTFLTAMGATRDEATG